MSDPTPDYTDDYLPVERELREPAGEDDLPIQRPRLRRAGRGEGRERETIRHLLRDLPSFARLLGRLAKDPRVSKVDKGIVLATLGYMALPLDLIPDWIPFLGEIDDLYLLALALDRLLNNAGIDLLLEHWDGDVASLETAIAALDKLGSLLPDPVRGLLRQRIG
jgi:uncharacterized membrane protein YkvA (DUF1232 family)